MNRTYELMFIVRPDMAEEDQDKLISTLESAVSSSGGNVKNVEKMGKRRLAYMVRRFHEGIYILLTVEGGGALIHELERRLRVTEPVIKFLTVRTDEEEKRVEKIEAINYKDYRLLAQFVAESGRIVPRRLTGVCTPHQRRLSTAIKQARNIALLPFAGRAS